MKPPLVLAVGGLDPSGRAGLLADAETIRALGGHPLGVAACLTAQGTWTYRAEPVSPRVLDAQLASLLELAAPGAVKLGAIPDRKTLQLLLRRLGRLSAWWVVDPVVRTSRGQRLSRLVLVDYLALAGPRVVFTPNALEAAALLEKRPPGSLAEVEPLARGLLRVGFGAVVVKGGHLAGRPVDVVATAGQVSFLSQGERIRPPGERRGTGCRFASAMALHLAAGSEPLEAARQARRFVRRFLQGRILRQSF